MFLSHAFCLYSLKCEAGGVGCVCVCVSMCINVCVTWEHLCAVLQYLRSEGLPGPHQLAEETPYMCELTARAAEHSASRSQGLLLLHTHTSDTQTHTENNSFFLNNLQYLSATLQMAKISEHFVGAVMFRLRQYC